MAPGLRWALPAALLVAEYVALTLLVDLPMSGPAMRLVGAARMVVPTLIGGGAAGWLIARRSVRAGAWDAAALPAWRPWPPLAAHLAAFAITAGFAARLFGGGAPVDAAPFVAWTCCAAATAVLAALVAAPAATLLDVARRHLAVPLLAACAGLLSWRAVVAAERLWGALQAATLQGVALVLDAASADVVVDPAASLVGAGDFAVIVAPVCSGVDGLGLVLVFQAVWLALARARVHLGRALVAVVPLGAVAALAANVLRIALLVLVGASGRSDLAMGAFHSKLGWLLFVGIALATVAVVEHLPWVRKGDAPRDAAETGGVPRAAAAYVAPLVATLVVALLTSLWADRAFDAAYALRVVAAVAVLLALRRALPRPSLSLSWTPVLIGLATAAAWIAAAPGAAPRPDALAALAPAGQAAWIAVRLLGSCLVVPVVEELAFRGFLLPWLVHADFEAVSPRAWTWPALLLSSLAFGAVHEGWLLGAASGLAFAAARLRRGRLSDAVLAHAIANAGIAAAVLIGGRWALWP